MYAMNDPEESEFFKKNLVWLLVVGAIVVMGLLMWNGLDKVVNDSVDRMSTVTGNFSCLPLKKGVVPGKECTLGIRSKDGSFYALDVSRIQDANTDLKAEDTIAVTGFLLPASTINDSQWEDYDVSGVIKVNTLLRTR